MLNEPKNICHVVIYAKHALHNFHKAYGKQFGTSTLSDYENELTKLYQDTKKEIKIANQNWDDSDSDCFDNQQDAFTGLAIDEKKINKIVHTLNL